MTRLRFARSIGFASVCAVSLGCGNSGGNASKSSAAAKPSATTGAAKSQATSATVAAAPTAAATPTTASSTTTGGGELAAIDAIADRGPAAAAETPNLVKLLDSSDVEIRVRAARALAAIGPGAASAVDALAGKLKDESPRVRAYAAHALGMIGKPAESSFEKLVTLITDADPQVRREAVKAIRHLKVDRAKLIPALVAVLEKSTSAEVVPAMQAIAEAGKDAVPGLIEALKHPEAAYWALQILADIGPDAADAAPAVAPLLTDARAEVRREAVLCLGHLGQAAKPQAAAILALAGDKDSGTRAAVVWSAVMVGADAATAKEPVAKLQADADPLVQLVAAWGNARFSPDDAAARTAAVAKATAALKDQSPKIRAAAARALVDLKVTAATDPDAVEAIVHALADHDSTVSGIVAQALVDGGEKSVPRLIKALDRPEVKGFAAAVLIRLGPTGKGAKDAVLPLAKDADPNLRAVGIAALVSIAGSDADVLNLAAAALDDPHTEVRRSAAYALAQLGPAAKPVEAALKKHADDADPVVKDAVNHALTAPTP